MAKLELCRGAAGLEEEGGSLLLLMGVNPLPPPAPPPFLLPEGHNDDEKEEEEGSTATGALKGACGLPRGVGGNFDEVKRPLLLQWARHQASSSVAGERSRP